MDFTQTDGNLPETWVAEDVDTASTAIVVGSGFGGAVTACRLAQAGLKVLLIERGRRYEAGDFPSLPPDSALLPDLRRWTWKSSQGLWDIVDLEEIVSVQAAGYGGGSLIYANVHLRPPDHVFDDKWPAVYRNRACLEPFYKLAASMLDVAPIDKHATLFPRLIKTDQMRRAIDQLGRHDAFFLPPLAVTYRAQTNAHGRQQKACTGCGACCTGCPETAKNTLDFNYLAVAETHGTRVATQCEVTKITQLHPEGWQVDCIDHLTARRRRFSAPYLFLCAGSVHSTRLLASARLNRRSSAVKSRVGVGYFPGGDSIGVAYETTEPQYPSFGPAITTSTVNWNPGSDASFFLLQEGGYAPALERLIGMLRAPAWVGRNRVTRIGKATLPASKISPPLQPPPEDPKPLVLVSFVDDVLNAIGNGDFATVASEALRRGWSSFLDELKEPLLLPPIVGRTIDLSIDAWLQRFWLTKWLGTRGGLAQGLTWFSKLLIRHAFGDSETIARRALGAIVSSANLSSAEVAKRILGYEDCGAKHRVMMLAMGRDAASGALHYDGRRDRMIADLNLFGLAAGYAAEEQLMADLAGVFGGELRTNPAWSFLGKPITVHNQGGCGMSDDPSLGVTDPDGQVHGCAGLYVADGSILCSSVGVNPSATITAIAERNALAFIQKLKKDDHWPDNDSSAGARDYQRQRAQADTWAKAATHWALRPPSPTTPVTSANEPLGIQFKEVMQGYYQPGVRQPGTEAGYRAAETNGRPQFPVRLNLDASVANLARFFEDDYHRMEIGGTITLRLPDASTEKTFPVCGTLELFVPPRKRYGISHNNKARLAAQNHFATRPYRTLVGNPSRGEDRRMNYELTFTDHLSRPFHLSGYKRIKDDPGFDAWRDTSSLFITLSTTGTLPGAAADQPPVQGAGVVHVDLDTFIFGQLPSMTVIGGRGHVEAEDPTRAMWAKAKFATFFFSTLQRIYAPEVTAAIGALFKPNANNIRHTQ